MDELSFIDLSAGHYSELLKNNPELLRKSIKQSAGWTRKLGGIFRLIGLPAEIENELKNFVKEKK